AVAPAEVVHPAPLGDDEDLHQREDGGDEPAAPFLGRLQEPAGRLPELFVALEVVDEEHGVDPIERRPAARPGPLGAPHSQDSRSRSTAAAPPSSRHISAPSPRELSVHPPGAARSTTCSPSRARYTRSPAFSPRRRRTSVGMVIWYFSVSLAVAMTMACPLGFL